MPTTEELQLQVTELQSQLSILKDSMNFFIRHVPYIYPQKTSYDTSGNPISGTFTIELPITHLLPNSVIYFIPTVNSLGTEDAPVVNTLRISQTIGQVTTVKEYTLVKEHQDGGFDNIRNYDIRPYRLCMLRLENESAVVLNYAFGSGEVTLGDLTVINPAMFHSIPLYHNDATDTNERLAIYSDINDLRGKITALEEKIISGTTEPSAALELKPVGTIYIRVEE